MEFKLQSNLGYIRAVSGLFITSQAPHGITNKEMWILAHLIDVVGDKGEFNRTERVALSNKINEPVQVTTNYMNSLKRKGAVTKNNLPHPIFYRKQIVIKRESQQNTV